MEKMIYLLLAFLYFTLPTLQAQDIDFPLSKSEITKYESRVRIRRLPKVRITHADAYKIATRQTVYSPKTKEIIYDVINVNGPTAEPEEYSMKKFQNGKWRKFPFIDNLGFAGIGYNLTKGNSVAKTINMSCFKNPLTKGRYQVNSFVFLNIYTYCYLTKDGIVPDKGTEMEGPFVFKVLSSRNDSIRILFENHTNLDVQPVFLPSVGMDDEYMSHPFARSGYVGEAKYMRKRARLKGGEAMLFTIPVSWNVNKITDKNYKKRFAAGRLPNGNYKIGLQLEVYMNTEFEVKQ